MCTGDSFSFTLFYCIAAHVHVCIVALPQSVTSTKYSCLSESRGSGLL